MTKRLRVAKPPEERREELLAAASQLFASRGFSRTAVSDIVKALGVAQGTFYYYFKSKEDVFLAIFEAHLNDLAERLWSIPKDSNLSAVQKLNTLITSLLTENTWQKDDPLLREIHSPDNVGLHQKVSARTVKVLAPLFASVLEEGIREGVFRLRHPQKVAEFALAGTLFWLDPLVFDWTKEEINDRVQVLSRILEQILDAEEGSIAVPMTRLADKYPEQQAAIGRATGGKQNEHEN